MSCLDTFYVSHFEEKDEYIRITEKGLLLDKADFSEKGMRLISGSIPEILTRQAL
jgi:hypothetical protein